MRLKAPAFWYNSENVFARIMALALAPFTLFWRASHALRQMRARAYKSSIPVICVGNLTVGGSGKTPAALALMEIVHRAGIASAPCFLSRGYGGRLKGPIRVEAHHLSADVGDEPPLLARMAPTIISLDRRAGAIRAEQSGKDLIVMDDGLQNPALMKTLSFVVIDGASAFGNRHLIPAGPLREKLAAGLKKADAFILIGDDKRSAAALLPQDKPLFRARLRPGAVMDRNAAYIAFCGMGRPEKFRATLDELGLNIIDWRVFPDHYRYMDKDLRALDEAAKKKNARLITTEKDAQRLLPGFRWRNKPVVLPVRLEWETPAALESFLKEKLRAS